MCLREMRAQKVTEGAVGKNITWKFMMIFVPLRQTKEPLSGIDHLWERRIHILFAVWGPVSTAAVMFSISNWDKYIASVQKDISKHQK